MFSVLLILLGKISHYLRNEHQPAYLRNGADVCFVFEGCLTMHLPHEII